MKTVADPVTITDLKNKIMYPNRTQHDLLEEMRKFYKTTKKNDLED